MSVQLRNPELVRLLAADFVTRREVVATAGNRLTLTNTDLTVQGGGALVLSAAGNYTLTVPETGTAALLGASNVFTGLMTLIGGGRNPTFLMIDESGPIRFSAEVYSNNAGDEPQFNFRHARGTLASPSATLNNDELGTISFAGYATALASAAQIRAYADADFGTAGDSSDSPGRLEFLTVPDGSSTMTLRMVIKSNGQIGIGTSTPTTSALLDLTSTTGALLVPRMTSTQRDALTATNGMIIYNTTTSTIQAYAGGTWTSL